MTFTSAFRKTLPVIALASVSAAGCVKKTDNVDSQVAWTASSGLSSTEVNRALNARVAFKVNLSTNRATLYKNGVAVDQWNIATADVSGEYHNGLPQVTPQGIYAVDDMQMCPAWYPRNPVNPATGRVVQSESERASVFANNPSLYGPCGARNPLGKYVLWFQGAYGLHGNAAEEILELPDANDRRVSGGCIRNPNNKIRDVFHNILDSFESLSGFSGSVAAMESRDLNNRWTITQSVASLDMRVVVGRWATDPALRSSVDAPAVATPSAQPSSPNKNSSAGQNAVALSPVQKEMPEPVATAAPVLNANKQFCNIGSVDQESNIAPVYLNVPSPTANVASFYRMGWPVTVWADVAGTSYVKVNRGFIDKKYLTNCSPAL
ncbi:MAG: L,D-transpeptidase catalytic domain [Pseudomonadota bacterium]